MVGAAELATGITMPFVEQGDPRGTPVVLIHAWVEAMGCFDRLRPLLPSALHVIAMDQRGHGGASKPADGYSLASLAADIVAFLDALDLPAAVLVGSSSGGYVAQQVAATAGDRVAGLVLVGAPHNLHRHMPFVDEVDRLTDPLDPAWVADSLTWFPGLQDVPDWFLSDRVRDGLAAPAHVWRNALHGLVEATPPTESGAITAPTLILWGERDDLLGRAQGDALAAAIPGSRLVIYEQTGHLVLWERPERVAADIVRFVNGVDA